jgi:hypothetical protein
MMLFRFVIGEFNRAVQKEVSEVGVFVVVWWAEVVEVGASAK